MKRVFSILFFIFLFFSQKVAAQTNCVNVTASGYKNNFGRWEEVVTASNECAYKVEVKLKVEVWRNGSWVILGGPWSGDYHIVSIGGYSSNSFLQLTTDGNDDIRSKIISVERK